jgi:LysM repeat protein
LLLPTPTKEADAAAAPTVNPTSLALALVPTATPTQAPTATPTPVTYTVQPGDTFLVIANRLGVTAEALRAANQMTPDDARLLRPGQVLVVPSGDTPVAPASATVAPAAPAAAPTATSAPTATPIPSPTPVAMRLAAPQLRSPENDATIGCSSVDSLTWLGVDFIQPGDQYIMHLGFVNGRDDAGNESITWVLNQPRPSNRTAWEMDNDLCALAPQEFGREWRWYVEVVDEQGEAVSPASATWRFSWN